MAQLTTRSSTVLCALLAACTVGEGPPGEAGPGGDADRLVCKDRLSAPLAAHEHIAEGANPAGPRTGLSCIASGCHLGGATGVGALEFLFAGSVYTENVRPGTTPATGVFVRIFKMGNDKSIDSVAADAAGNFIFRPGGAGGALDQFPYQTDVTACGVPTPEVRPMVTLLGGPADRNCSAAGTCHGDGGSTAQVNIPLP